LTDTIHPIDIILHKRDGLELSTAEIQTLIDAVVLYGEHQIAAQRDQAPSATKTITEAQLGSLLMAIFQRGLSLRELADLTRAMRFSGETFDASPLNSFTIDKHSTGGVGDKTSLLIAPIIAAAGLELNPSISVPMISGRSLGHTGGTLDKLETIPGFDTQLSLVRMTEVLLETHACATTPAPSSRRSSSVPAS
jgi:thymidine phosphorylase